MRIQSWRLLFVVLILFSCKKDGDTPLTPLNLLEYGVPITVLAPEQPDIQTLDLIVQKDITIQKGNDYYVQLFASNATSYQLPKLKSDLLQQVNDNPYFGEVIEEQENGFIYRLQIDSVQNFGFRYFRIMGDKEYVFQTGLVGTFTEEQVRRMYDAVQYEAN